MTEYYKLRNKYREKVRKLQENCNHQEPERYTKIYTGVYIKFCTICNKELKFSWNGKKSGEF